MARISELGLEGGALLHGSDLEKARLDRVAVVVAAVREAPRNFGAPLILVFDAEAIPGTDIAQWACNQTEANRLGRRISDNTDEWVGWGIILDRVLVNNPTLGKRVPGLTVAHVVSPSELEGRRTSKPKRGKDVKINKPDAPKVDYSKIAF